jgi:MFS family permease
MADLLSFAPIYGLFVVGGFGTFAVYLPELFPTRNRATGQGFCWNAARILTAAGPVATGAIVSAFGSAPAAPVENEPVSDDWPELRKRVLACDILVIGSPVWLGQLSSVAKRVIERMDAFLGERDEMQRMPSYGKVGLAAVVGTRTEPITSPRDLFGGRGDGGQELYRP